MTFVTPSPVDQKRVAADFAEAVNMTAAELGDWLLTPASLGVGWKGAEGQLNESVGHASGRRIVDILRTPAAKLTEMDYSHMRKTVGFIRRHQAQKPINIVTSRWRCSLMNWGHDPLRDQRYL